MESVAQQVVLFHDMLQALVAQRKYVKLFYFSELHELLPLTSLVTGLTTGPEGERLETAAGGPISVERLVSVNGVQNPVYTEYETCLTCRCDS